MLQRITIGFAFLLFAFAQPALAEPEQFQLDIKGQHAFVMFKISHIGFAWIYGSFNDFEGSFTYDAENPANNSAEVTVDVASIDTNHAERDKHLRGEDFFHVDEFPEARFVATGYEKTGEASAELTGALTIKGNTREVTMDVTEMAAREDPWGNFRRAFSAKTELRLKDFGIDYDLGPVQTAELIISLEGVRQ